MAGPVLRQRTGATISRPIPRLAAIAMSTSGRSATPGTGGRAQANVHEAMLEYNRKAGRDLDLYLHVGDMAYGSGTDNEFSGQLFRDV